MRIRTSVSSVKGSVSTSPPSDHLVSSDKHDAADMREKILKRRKSRTSLWRRCCGCRPTPLTSLPWMKLLVVCWVLSLLFALVAAVLWLAFGVSADSGAAVVGAKAQEVVSSQQLLANSKSRKNDGDLTAMLMIPNWRNALEPDDILPQLAANRVGADVVCDFEEAAAGFLAGCCDDGCKNYEAKADAMAQCRKDDMCTGVLKAGGRQSYQCRSGLSIQESPSGETSFLKKCTENKKPAKDKRKAFARDSRPKRAKTRNAQCDLVETGPFVKKGFIPNCVEADAKCEQWFDSFNEAKTGCLKYEDCVGIVKHGEMGDFQMRRGLDGEWQKVASGKPSLASDITVMQSPAAEVSYLKECGAASAALRDDSGGADHCVYSQPAAGYLPGCVQSANGDCLTFYYFYEATAKCDALGSKCGGITRVRVTPGKNSFELRQSKEVVAFDNDGDFELRQEHSYVKDCDAMRVETERQKEERRRKALKRYETVGTHEEVAGGSLETVYLGVASYRDAMCRESVHSAFDNAKHPQRVYVGVVQQNRRGDIPCVRLTTDKEEAAMRASDMKEIPHFAVFNATCEDRPEHLFCRYASHIRVDAVNAKDASGPVFGRHKADMLFRGEYFALQIDAHMTLIKHWDVHAISEWKAVGNEYAVLSTYPSEVTKALDRDTQESKIKSATVICNTRILKSGMFKHNAAGEILFPPTHESKPMFAPFLGAGIVFSRGHRIVRVPYDCCLPMVFDGEEFSLGLRLFASGYDIYAPNFSFAFHPYNRKGGNQPPMFWENRDDGRLRRSQNRILYALNQNRDGNEDFDHTDIERYSIADIRPVETYYSILGIDFATRKVRDNCPKAFNGIFHDSIHPFLRKDGRGIDYSKVYAPILDIP